MIYSILEGKQAEEYKARKDSDKSKKNIASRNRDIRRYGLGTVGIKSGSQDDYNRLGVAYSKAKSEVDKREKKMNDAYKRYGHYIKLTPNNAVSRKASDIIEKADRDWINADDNYISDAINRHMRRHPKQYAKPKNESTIFSDIEII